MSRLILFGKKENGDSNEERRKRRFNENLKMQKLSRSQSWFERRIKAEIKKSEPMEVLMDEIEMMEINNNNINSIFEPDTLIRKDWVSDLHHYSISRQWITVDKFARLVTNHPKPALDDLVKLRLFPRFFELLQTYESPRIQHNVALILCEMSELSIMDQMPPDAIEVVEKLLKSTKCMNTKLLLIELVANFSDNDVVECRDKILASGCWTEILDLMLKFDFSSKSKETIKLFRIGCYAIQIICSAARKLPDFNHASKSLPIIKNLMRSCEDHDVLKSCAIALTSFTLHSIRVVLDLKLNDVIVGLLDIDKHRNELVYEALRVVGNILNGSADEAQEMIDSGVVPILHQLMFHEEYCIKVRASWCISNICCGSQDQIEVLFSENIYRDIVEQFVIGPADVQYEFAFAINCSISKDRTSREQMKKILSFDVIDVLCDALKTIKIEDTLLVVVGALRRLVNYDAEILERVCHKIGKLRVKIKFI